MIMPYHAPVLLKETVDLLVGIPGGVYVDCTVGGGGHAREILNRLDSAGRLVGIDRDEDAIAFARNALREKLDQVVFVKGDFGDLEFCLEQAKTDKVAGILLDLGVSSHQIDTGSRGFSFQRSGPLDMRMDQSKGITAEEVVNHYEEHELARIIKELGEERNAKLIAREITKCRRRQTIQTTEALREIVAHRVPDRHLNKTLARVFQAIRIEVNGELRSLESALRLSVERLVPGGRLAVISYHSLEDRRVKQFMKSEASGREEADYVELARPRIRKFKIMTKRPVLASEEEIRANPRARSAKLRAAERTDK